MTVPLAHLVKERAGQGLVGSWLELSGHELLPAYEQAPSRGVCAPTPPRQSRKGTAVMRPYEDPNSHLDAKDQEARIR